MLLVNPQSLDHLADRVKQSLLGSDPLLLERVSFLEGSDRLLLEMAMRNRLSTRQMGLEVGLTPGTVSRRLRRIIHRLHDPIVEALLDPSCPVARVHHRIGLDYFLRRLPLCEIARRSRLTCSQVRLVLGYLRGWQRGLSQRGRHEGKLLTK
jgi:hypothetical protein